jgi:hypothetical protein
MRQRLIPNEGPLQTPGPSTAHQAPAPHRPRQQQPASRLVIIREGQFVHTARHQRRSRRSP